MNSRLVPFTLRAKHNMVVRKILLQESAIISVVVERQRIVVKMNEGSEWVNNKPSPTDSKFWYQYTRKYHDNRRWDMPSPDALALEMLQ